MGSAMAEPDLSRVARRRADSRRAILDAAWAVAAESGLESLSLREIAARVGMRAPSLYSYFPSKAAILDALFVDGYHALDDVLADVVAALPLRATPRRRLGDLLRAWIGFCQADPARYRLMFTSAVPGWRPAPEAYAASLENYRRFGANLALAGVTDPEDLDLCTALAAGLVAQQMSNDPDGDRWLRRVDDVVDMFLRYTTSRARRSARSPRESR
jgi:AcrR family transcriptional regulator